MSKTERPTANKSDFVRKHPQLSSAEVIAKAKAAGLVVTPNLVYMVRARAKAASASKARGAASAGTRPRAAKPGAAAPSGGQASPAKRTTLSASDFIRTLPTSLTAKEAIAKGAAVGLSFTPNLVYLVRSKAAKRAAPRRAVAPSASASSVGQVGQVGQVAQVPQAVGGAEAVIARLIVRHGIDRVRGLVDDAAARIASVLAG